MRFWFKFVDYLIRYNGKLILIDKPRRNVNFSVIKPMISVGFTLRVEGFTLLIDILTIDKPFIKHRSILAIHFFLLLKRVR